MPSIFTSTKFFNQPIDHQSTSNDRLKPVMTTGLVNMHIDRSIANLDDCFPRHHVIHLGKPRGGGGGGSKLITFSHS